MRAWVEADILYLHADDVPRYKKCGSVVRNSYFWALRSITGRAKLGEAWEFEAAVWFALQRMLISFTDSGYLGSSETQLEFSEAAVIPSVLQPIATWVPIEWFMDDSEDFAVEPLVTEREQGMRQGEGQEQRWRPGLRGRQRRQGGENQERPSPPYSSYI